MLQIDKTIKKLEEALEKTRTALQELDIAEDEALARELQASYNNVYVGGEEFSALSAEIIKQQTDQIAPDEITAKLIADSLDRSSRSLVHSDDKEIFKYVAEIDEIYAKQCVDQIEKDNIIAKQLSDDYIANIDVLSADTTRLSPADVTRLSSACAARPSSSACPARPSSAACPARPSSAACVARSSLAACAAKPLLAVCAARPSSSACAQSQFLDRENFINSSRSRFSEMTAAGAAALMRQEKQNTIPAEEAMKKYKSEYQYLNRLD